MSIDQNEFIHPPIDQKGLVLDIIREMQISDHPERLWDQAIMLARDEEKIGRTVSSYPDIQVDEIVALGERMQKLHSIEEKYQILMEKTNSGKLWYDILLGDGNKILFVPVERAVRKKFKKTHTKWGKAADIGMGTGNTMRSIAPYCEEVYGVDLASFALRSAKDLGLPDNASLVQGPANHLPFKSKSLDLIVSNGLIYYLSPEETSEFVQELARVLKRGGKFFESNIIREEDELVPKILADNVGNAKNALIDLVGKLANGGGHPDSLGMVDFNEILLQNGFSLTTFHRDSSNRILFEYTRV